MLTEKVCVCCVKAFTDETPGMAGIFSRQAKAAGVCPQCRVKYSDVPVAIFARTTARIGSIPLPSGVYRPP